MNIWKLLRKKKKKEATIQKKEKNEIKKDQNLIYFVNYKIKKSIKILILFLVSLLIIISVKIGYDRSENLYDRYYQPAELYITRSANIIEKSNYYYLQKDYKAAFKSFGEVLEMDSNNNYARFYYSICAIEIGQLDIAEKNLNILINNESVYIEYSEWYLSLCYLKNSDNDKALIFLRHIVSEDSNPYKVKAEEILKKLQ